MLLFVLFNLYFQQVFTIHGYLVDRVFCLALVLMEHRDIASYRRVFSKIRRKINLQDKTGHQQMQWLTLKLVSLSTQFIFKLSALCGICALNSKIVQFLQSCKPRSLEVPWLILLNVGRVELYPCKVPLLLRKRTT